MADINDYFNKQSNNNNKQTNNNNSSNKQTNNNDPFGKIPFDELGNKIYIIYTIIALVVVLVIAKPFAIVNAGEVGIKVTTGKYDPIPLNPGFHFYMPFVQKIIIVDTKVRIINYVENENEISFDRSVKNRRAIRVLDKRGLPITIELTMQYKLRAISSPQTIATWGVGWEDKIINPAVRDIVRTVIGGFKAEELPQKRNEIAKDIETKLIDYISKLTNEPVVFESVQLRNIGLPEKIKEQIERVQVAKQEVERTRYEVERSKQEAEKRAALARGEADAKRIQAQGKADSITIEANAQSKANILIGKSLNRKVLQLKQLDVQNSFNDALRENKDAKIFLTPGGSVPNIWVDMKDGKQQKTSVK